MPPGNKWLYGNNYLGRIQSLSANNINGCSSKPLADSLSRSTSPFVVFLVYQKSGIPESHILDTFSIPQPTTRHDSGSALQGKVGPGKARYRTG